MLNIISYNIWFEPVFDYDRFEVLVEVLLQKDADVICLQEIRPHIHKKLINRLTNYKYVYPENILTSYGCAIFSKYRMTNCTSHKFNTDMGRELLIAHIPIPYFDISNVSDKNYQEVSSKEIIITTTHFESLFDQVSPNIKKIDQYNETNKILNKLYNNHKNVILCADTNILKHEEIYFIPTNTNNKNNDTILWNDAWKLKGNRKDIFTYDSYRNYFLKQRMPKYRSRLDRIIYKADSYGLHEYTLISGVEMGYSVEPSDHFGIQCIFKPL